MKWETFTSRLDRAEIFRRIAQYAEPAGRSWRHTPGTVFYRLCGDSKFLLVKTPSWPDAGQPCFCGVLSPGAEGSTVIRGRFTQPPGMKKALIPFTLMAPVLVLLVGGLSFLLPALLFWAVGGVVVYDLFYVLAPTLWKEERRAVLDFIGEHLLS